MARHTHKFQRLSDEAIFCECGEIKRLAAPAPTPNVTIYPYTPPTTYPTFIWSDTSGATTVTNGNVTTGTTTWRVE